MATKYMINKVQQHYKNQFMFTACRKQIDSEVDQSTLESQAIMLIHVSSPAAAKEQDLDLVTRDSSQNGWKKI